MNHKVLVIPSDASRAAVAAKRLCSAAHDRAMPTVSLQSMTGHIPEILFQTARECEANEVTLPAAIDNYREAIELAPDWVEAHLNLGVVYYRLGRFEEARAEFAWAAGIDPQNGICRYNLGCVLEDQGKFGEAILHLRQAAQAMPGDADVHFNLALAYEKRGRRRLARGEWMLCLRCAPNGPWASQARAHLERCGARRQGASRTSFDYRS